MSMQFPNQATKNILNTLFNTSGFHLRLFSNNLTVGAATVIGDFVEVSGGGYVPIALSAGNWVFTTGAPSVAQYNVFLTFVFTGAPSPNTTYGYYITDASGALIACENFTLVNPITGTQIPIQLHITGAMA